MIEMTLEEDLPEEFRGGTLQINQDGKIMNASKPTSPEKQQIDKKSTNEKNSGNTKSSSYSWGTSFLLPSSLTSVPNKISETLFHTNNTNNSNKKTEPSPKKTNQIQATFNINEDANNFFTFRDGVVERAVKDCLEQFVDPEIDGALLASYLLTQINYWDTDKERLVVLTEKSLFLIKYDFIALKRLGCKKLPLEEIDYVIIGDLIYPAGSLIPRINGFANGISNILENCLFSRWQTNDSNKQIEQIYQSRDRNTKGCRIIFNKGEPINFKSKWNPFNDDIPFWTLTYHPLYYHNDCQEENQRNLYNLDLFIEKLCQILCAIQSNNESSFIQHSNIILDNYIGLGSIIHNRNSLGFFKVRGKFSF